MGTMGRGFETRLEVTGADVKGDRIEVQARMDVTIKMPEHTRGVPGALEASVESAGQELKRRLYREVMERADRDLIVRGRGGKKDEGIELRGKAGYTIKTVFGTVKMKRTRISHKADESQEVPAGRAWETPQGVLITPGLRESCCDVMLQESSGDTVKAIEQRAGEEGLLAKSTVLKIVEEEGRRLRAAQMERAEGVLKADPAARVLLGKKRSGEPEGPGVEAGEEEHEEEPTPPFWDSAGVGKKALS